jgi:hypothetical protein
MMATVTFENYLATGGNGDYPLGSLQYQALKKLYESFTLTQREALKAVYSVAVNNDGTVNTATLEGISAVITQSATGTAAERADNLAAAIEAILTVRHPGANVIVTTVHHGNSVYSTVSHVSP